MSFNNDTDTKTSKRVSRQVLLYPWSGMVLLTDNRLRAIAFWQTKRLPYARVNISVLVDDLSATLRLALNEYQGQEEYVGKIEMLLHHLQRIEISPETSREHMYAIIERPDPALALLLTQRSHAARQSTGLGVRSTGVRAGEAGTRKGFITFGLHS